MKQLTARSSKCLTRCSQIQTLPFHHGYTLTWLYYYRCGSTGWAFDLYLSDQQTSFSSKDPFRLKASAGRRGDSSRGSEEGIVEQHCKGSRSPAVQGNDPIPATRTLKESPVFPRGQDSRSSSTWSPPHSSSLSIEPKLNWNATTRWTPARDNRVTGFWKCANFGALKMKRWNKSSKHK